MRSARSLPIGAAACLALEVFDLIIVSQRSPNFEGRRVLACAMEKDRRMPVLVLTRSIEMPCYLEAMQLGACDYLEKPLPPSEIGRLVAKFVPTRLGAA
jgi:two-component system, NtrC family, phosphoglycerate transport system response regulator PgtA